MSAVHFKLSKPDGLTRRVSFPQRPSWDVLAAKIQFLYDLPIEHIAVSYIDTDGDEVTLSSEEELQDYYATTPLDSPIKFIVLDLGSIRASLDEDKPLPATPPQAASSRNTFGSGVPLVFEVEDDWQRLGLSPMYTSSPNGRDFDSPHAFVEVVETEADSASQTDDKGSQSSSDYGQVLGEEKGKVPVRDLRAKVSDDVSSSASVVDDDSPNKPPVHVQIHGLRGVHSDTFGPPLRSPPPSHIPVMPSLRSSSPPGPIRPVSSVSDDTSTARLSSPFFAPGPDPKTPPATIPDHVEDDPPLPEIAPGPTPAASLTNDVASLLNSLSSAFTAHPELSDGLRHLLRNATNGTYWATHRESVSRAAEGIRRAAQEVQDAAVASAKDARVAAEEEAGRRVTEAIGNILQAFTQATGGAPDVRSPGAAPSESAQGNNASTAGQSNAQAPLPPPPIITSNWNQWARSAPLSSAAPPSAVPPPGIVQPSLSSGYPQPGTLQPGAYAPPPGAVPPPGYIPAWSQFKPYPQPQSTVDAPISSIPPSEPAEVSYYGASPRSRPRASELRASLEAAKQNYKAEKERYRQEREMRRKLKEQQKNSSGDSTTAGADVFGPLPVSTEKPGEPSAQPYPASPSVQRPTTPPAQIISNARGSFPQFELHSLPHSPRSPRKPNAASGSRRDRGPEMPDRSQEETMKHLVSRLGDMGFTESSYPLLRKMVSARLPQDGKRISRAEEDDLVSDVVDELLTPPAKASPPKASGSGLRVQDLD